MHTQGANIYCGNNDLALDLKAHGGAKEFGTHKDCLRKGYALGINQRIPNMDRFLRKWGNAYKAHIPQHLVYVATYALLENTPFQHIVAEGFSVVIYISLLARFCFVPFLVILNTREELAETALPQGLLAWPAALIWPLPASAALRCCSARRSSI